MQEIIDYRTMSSPHIGTMRIIFEDMSIGRTYAK